MTNYITINGVKKRTFTIPVTLTELSDTQVNIERFDEQILWDDGTDILWDDNSQILWSTHTDVNPRIIKARKRSFIVQAVKR